MIATSIVLILFGGALSRLLESLMPMPVPTALSSGDGGAASTPGLTPGIDFSVTTLLNWGAAILVLLGLVLVGCALLQRRCTLYAITLSPRFGGRITKRQGILYRQTVAVPLAMVNDLVLQEPLLGRILGWGHVDIETGNDYQGDRLDYMPNPRHFYEVWSNLLGGGYGIYGEQGRGTRPANSHGRRLRR
jgi:hypothetical protein